MTTQLEMPKDYAGFKAWIDEFYPEIPYNPAVTDSQYAEQARRRNGRYGSIDRCWEARLRRLEDLEFVAFIRDYRKDPERTSVPQSAIISSEIALRKDLRMLSGEWIDCPRCTDL